MARRYPADHLVRFRHAISVLLLGYLAVFLNVVLPGHTRGAITLDGKHTPAAGCCCCCCCGSSKASRPSQGRPSQRDREHCALCDFAAHVTPAVPVDFRPPPMALLALLPPPTPTFVASVERLRTYLACGPPPARA